VLFIFLPPLLTSAAYALPIGAVWKNISSISLLAVGLVIATMAATAAIAHLVVGLAWSAAFVLGAIISPPDPIAATSVAARTGLRHRLVIILEGEGLMNDAIAIVAYGLAVEATLTSQFSWAHAGVELLRQVPAGVLVGLVIGWATNALRRRMDDVTVEGAISLLVPFVTYEVAIRLGVSGVLAVVTFGFMIQRHATEVAKPAARLAGRTIWSAVRFASSALVFFLLGLVIGEVLSTAMTSDELVSGVLVALTVIVLRLAWMYAAPHMTRLMRFRRPGPVPTWRELTVLGWSGMRGVVSLALALALPPLVSTDVANAVADPRTKIIVITFIVIVATLVAQGLALLPIVSRLRAGDPGREARDERRARARARDAGVRELLRIAEADPALSGICEMAASDVQSGELGIASNHIASAAAANALHAVLDAQRRVVVELRDGGDIGEGLAERLSTELDVDAMRLSGEVARLTGPE